MSTHQPMVANNIDEVLALLEKIITESEKKDDRIGYFAALYYKVTAQVKEDIAKGQFGNGSQLEKLDVVFANRFFHALDQWQQGIAPTRSWAVTFENVKKPSRLVLQHLLLGMNAHINLDLGIATVEASNGDIDSIRNDYDAINLILASLTYGIISKLNIVSPMLSMLGFSGTKSNSMLIQFSLGNARDGSWCFAELLAKKTGNDYNTYIADRDKEIAALGQSIVTARGVLKFGIWLIHLFEWKNVKRIIQTLHTYKKPYKKDMKL